MSAQTTTQTTSGSAGGTDSDIPLYNFEMQNQNAIKESYPLVSYLRTTVGVGSANIVGVPSMAITGLSGDELGVCAANVMYEELSKLPGGFSILTNSVFTEEVLANAREAAENIGCANIGADGLFGRKGAGSLMGVSRLVLNSAMSDPMPVRLAYYTHDLAQRIPIIKNTTYAQESRAYDTFYGSSIALSIWKVSRNIAYAMMAIFMLIIGIMIIMRKEIGRSYVTVQTAIPRVVISLILITFSYPIGAVLASMIPYLILTVLLLFFSEMLSQTGSGLMDIAGGFQDVADFRILLIYVLTLVITFGVGGIFAIAAGLLLLLLTVIALLSAGIKMLLIYLKLILDIVFAPIQFAVAAIPGKDDIIANWFKRIAAKVVTIPAIAFFIVLAWFIIRMPLSDPNLFGALVSAPAAPGVAGFVGSFVRIGNALFSLLMLPFMAIMTLFFSLRVDKKIEEFIVGAPKKR